MSHIFWWNPQIKKDKCSKVLCTEKYIACKQIGRPYCYWPTMQLVTMEANNGLMSALLVIPRDYLIYCNFCVPPFHENSKWRPTWLGLWVVNYFADFSALTGIYYLLLQYLYTFIKYLVFEWYAFCLITSRKQLWWTIGAQYTSGKSPFYMYILK